MSNIRVSICIIIFIILMPACLVKDIAIEKYYDNKKTASATSTLKLQSITSTIFNHDSTSITGEERVFERTWESNDNEKTIYIYQQILVTYINNEGFILKKKDLEIDEFNNQYGEDVVSGEFVLMPPNGYTTNFATTFDREFIYTGNSKQSVIETIDETWTYQGDIINYTNLAGVMFAQVRHWSVLVEIHDDLNNLIDSFISERYYADDYLYAPVQISDVYGAHALGYADINGITVGNPPIDPSSLPDGTIVSPQSDLIAFTGNSVSFEGIASDSNGTRLTPNWYKVELLSKNNKIEEFLGQGQKIDVSFPAAGLFKIEMRLTGINGDDPTPASRNVAVATYNPANFESDSTITAPNIAAGVFPDLSLGNGDNKDFYAFSVTRPYGLFSFKIKMDNAVDIGQIGFELQNFQGLPVSGGQIIQNSVNGFVSIVFRHLPIGGYFLHVFLNDKKHDGLNVKDGGIGYTLTLGSSMPEHIFPHPQGENGDKVALSISNPYDEDLSVYIDGYTSSGGDGDLSSTILIPAKGSYYMDMSVMLKKSTSDWLLLRSDKPLPMISEHRNSENKTLSIGNLPESFYPKLYTSHVATKSGIWQTELNLVRGSNEVGTINMSIDSSVHELELLNQKQTKLKLNMVDLVGPDIVDDNGWGSIDNSDGSPGVAGVERFKTIADSLNWDVELLLTPAANDHPGFVYFEKTLIYPHVPSKGDGSLPLQFFTGIALANLGSTTNNIHLQAYNDAGDKTSSSSFDLPPYVKTSFLVKDKFPEQDIADGKIAWIAATTTSDVVGFELYGIVPDWLGGFEALSGTSTILAMPTILSTRQDDFLGFAMLNPNSEKANFTITGYDSNGVVIATLSTTLDANQKRVSANGALFQANNSSAAFDMDIALVMVTSDLPLLGFVLNVTKDNHALGTFNAMAIAE